MPAKPMQASRIRASPQMQELGHFVGELLLTGAESRAHCLVGLIAPRVAKAESEVEMDLDRAMKNPASAFVTPEALCESSELTAEQKGAVLLQWKDQLEQLQAADDEGMQKSEAATGTTGDLLGRVTSILSRINADLKQASKL